MLTLEQILPSLESLGVWSYWIIALGAFLEAVFLIGAFIPGTLVVGAGGLLVQQGALDLFDLVWFVAIGSALGGEVDYWIGSLSRRKMRTQWPPAEKSGLARALDLFLRHGGLALVIGRFLGPVAGSVPVVASISGMSRRRFSTWNLISGFPFAFVMIGVGYGLGGVASTLGPLATRVGAFAVAVLALLLVLWWLVLRMVRVAPVAASLARSVGQAVLENPDIVRIGNDHPRLAKFLRNRFDRDRVSGLPTTMLVVMLGYIVAIWAGSVFDFLMSDPIVQADTRLANLIHAFWSPGALRAAAYVTGLGDWRVVGLLLVAATAAIWVRGRTDLLAGLWVAVVGNVASVGALKHVFARPRPELGYFIETSGSFPSGHAAISVAFYGFFVPCCVAGQSPAPIGGGDICGDAGIPDRA